MPEANYHFSGQGYPAFEGQKKRSNKKWIVSSLVKFALLVSLQLGKILGVCIAALVIVGVVVGVVVATKKTSSTRSTTGASSNSTASPNSPVKQTDPNDPSKFTKDPDLHQAFWGMAYTPAGSQLPDCGNNIGGIIFC